MKIKIIILAIVLSGCYTQKKAVEQVINAQARYPEDVSRLCHIFYPIKQWSYDSIVYKPGEIKWHHDTVTVDCDSVVSNGGSAQQPNGKNYVVKIPCPPCPSAVDTFLHYKSVVKESTAALQSEKLSGQRKDIEISELKGKVSEQKKAISIATWALIILAAYTLVRWILRMTTGLKIP